MKTLTAWLMVLCVGLFVFGCQPADTSAPAPDIPEPVVTDAEMGMEAPAEGEEAAEEAPAEGEEAAEEAPAEGEEAAEEAPAEGEKAPEGEAPAEKPAE